jgi:1-acyl-sn-glycerol-3-phosphate acyltransferase
VRHAPLWFLEACRPVVRLAARGFLRIRFQGLEHVPPTGPLLITPNHVTYLDPILITIPIHRVLHYLALEPFLRIRVLGAVMRWARTWPVREDEVNDRAARTAIRVLRAGEPLVIFPEGGRSRDGRLQAFRPGAFRLALALDAPVLPVTIAGGFDVWPVGRRLPRPGRVTITYHPVVTRKDVPLDVPRDDQAALMAELVRRRIAAAL